MAVIWEKEERGNETEGRRFLGVEFANVLAAGCGASGAWKPYLSKRPKTLVT